MMPTSRASSSPVMSAAPIPTSASARNNAPSARGACSVSNRKLSVLRAGGRHPVDPDVTHPCARGSAACPGDERIDGGRLALDLGDHAPVGLVPDPAGDLPPPRLLLHRSAVPDALHLALDGEACANRHQSPSIRRNASSSRRATPSFSAL